MGRLPVTGMGAQASFYDIIEIDQQVRSHRLYAI
jgi:hypothetical protein